VKKSRRRPTLPKFIQITAAEVVFEDTARSYHTSLYALDEVGWVWQYEFDHSVWVPLSPKRNASFRSDEET
jgi:hypothetical protein